MTMQRRDVLRLLAGAGLVVPFGRDAWAATAPANPTGRKLIVVMLRGAVDGLNVVAPVGDANYARLRPTIALAAPGKDGGALDLDGYFGLHPALARLQPLWQARRLAFVTALAAGRLPLAPGSDSPVLDPARVQATLAGSVSARTLGIVQRKPDNLRAAMLLGSPDFMQR
jgi:uncharacterized protein (DUF1501 family)